MKIPIVLPYMNSLAKVKPCRVFRLSRYVQPHKQGQSTLYIFGPDTTTILFFCPLRRIKHFRRRKNRSVMVFGPRIRSRLALRGYYVSSSQFVFPKNKETRVKKYRLLQKQNVTVSIGHFHRKPQPEPILRVFPANFTGKNHSIS